MITKRLYAIALFTFLGVSLIPTLNAQQSWTSPEEFRTEYTKFIDALSARVPASDQSTWAVGVRQKISDLRQQVNSASYQTMEQLAKASDRQRFTGMVDRMTAGNSKLQENAKSGLETFSVDGSGRIKPHTQGPILPPDFSGAVAGTTCSSTPTDAGTLDGEHIGLDVAIGLQVPLDYACETIVEILGEGTNAPFCVAAALAKAAEVILDSILGHQEFCNGLLAGATADATLNDVTDIHGDLDAVDAHLTNVNTDIDTRLAALDTHVTNVDNHISAEFIALDAHLVTLVNQLSTQLANAQDVLDASLKQIMKLELTPNGQKQIVPAILTCTGTNCPDVLTKCPGNNCSWNNVGPLP